MEILTLQITFLRTPEASYEGAAPQVNAKPERAGWKSGRKFLPIAQQSPSWQHAARSITLLSKHPLAKSRGIHEDNSNPDCALSCAFFLVPEVRKD